MKISFIWYGITGRYGIWKDGLWAAMKELEKEYEVSYHEPTDDIDPESIILFWEAPCTINHHENGKWYRKICELPNKKILLFAGGPIQREWIEPFDHVCVESKINADELEMLGIPHSTAFGINSDIFKPMRKEKIYDGIHHGTCASWKRQWLVGESVGDRGLIVGRGQDSDPYPFDRCRELGCTVLPETDPTELVNLMNQSHTCLQTSDYWGGGQRCTLEAMACGIPPIVMSDSPKNCEYVEESGLGLIAEPNTESIRHCVNTLKDNPPNPKALRDYVLSKWTPKHYSENLKKAICRAHQ